jgi:hypothetical protein
MMKPPGPWPPDDPRRTPVTLRGQYVADGVSDRALARLVRDGTLGRPRRGAYVAGDAWKGLDEEGRHSLRARAALLQAKVDAVLSHTTGLLEFDVPIWDLDLAEVHITRRDGRIGRQEAGVRQHRGVIEQGDVIARNGVDVMSPTRLGLEVTTIADVEHSLVVVNHLLHVGHTTPEMLAARYETMSQWPNTLITDLVLRLADPRIESVGESRFFHLCFRHRLPMPTPQYEIRDGSGKVVARLDFAWPELGVFLEFDGKVKYQRYLKEGESVTDAVLREKRREELVCRLTGWRCIRITWADLEHPERTAAMIREVLFPPATAA